MVNRDRSAAKVITSRRANTAAILVILTRWLKYAGERQRRRQRRLQLHGQRKLLGLTTIMDLERTALIPFAVNEWSHSEKLVFSENRTQAPPIEEENGK